MSSRAAGSAPRRCAWPRGEAMIAYHDAEWGVPVHDDRALFEALTLECAQAGLSWETILKRREGYRRAYRGFEPAKVARFGARDVARLLADPGIVRHRQKVEASIRNARLFLALQEEHGSFDAWLWGFVDGRPVVSRRSARSRMPARTPLSGRVSKELSRRGFGFVGSVTMLAFLQAVGVVNHHAVDCFRHAELTAPARSARSS